MSERRSGHRNKLENVVTVLQLYQNNLKPE